MYFTPAIVAAILAFTAVPVFAAPLPQLAGEGAACNSVLSSTDNGVGYGVEDAEDNTAATVSSTGAKLRLRQLAGEGAACNSVLSSTDNGVGYGVEDAEDNTAATVTSTGAKLRLRQLAGEGAACNSVLSSTDNGVGYGVEDAEDNTATTVSSTGAKLRLRQLAGEGAACNSVLSSTDNGVGYGVEDAEDNTAATVKSTGAKRMRRQLDKIANGAGAVGNAAGAGVVADPVQQEGDSVDGTLTSDAANAGAQAGNTETSTLEGAGSAVPKSRRQLDKIANGAGAVGNAAGAGVVADPVQQEGDSVDGTLTSDAANAGAQVGNTETSTLEGAGSAVPKSKRQLDKISNGAGAVGDAAGAGAVADPVAADGDTVDGQLTGDAATAGAQAGNLEVSTLEGAGSSVPKL